MLQNRGQTPVFSEQTGEQLRAAGDKVSGQLSIGLPPAVMLLLGPSLVEYFRRDYPQVHLHIREGLSVSRHSSQLVSHLRDVVHAKLHQIFNGESWHGKGVWIGDNLD